MESLRRMVQGPVFQYKGNVVSSLLYYKGNSDLVHSWDILLGRENLSKMSTSERHALGFRDEDMEIINQRIKVMIDAKEGR
jgi:hypothetical protein